MMLRKLKSAVIGLLFIGVMMAVIDFQIGSIIDIKIFLSMVMGVALLTLTSYKDKNSDVDRLVAYHCALTSVFASTLIYLERLSSQSVGLVTLPISPLLYGILIYIGFLVTSGNRETKNDSSDDFDGLDGDHHLQKDIGQASAIKSKISPTYSVKLYNLGLSDREVSIANEMLKRKTNKEIASEFFIAESTVKKHVQNILRKADVSNRQEFCRVIEADKEDQ